MFKIGDKIVLFIMLLLFATHVTLVEFSNMKRCILRMY